MTPRVSRVDSLISGVLGAVLLVTYVGIVAVDAFRKARATFDAAMAEIDAATGTYTVEQAGVGAR